MIHYMVLDVSLPVDGGLGGPILLLHPSEMLFRWDHR